ncbi:hypothetical protein Tco_0930377 [Tanacetum coccineum]
MLILWMAIKGKLLTQDKMRSSGTYDMIMQSDSESHGHLFFKCEISRQDWLQVQKMMRIAVRTTNLNETTDELAQEPCVNNIWSLIRRFCLAANVYLVWQERKFRLFRDEHRTRELSQIHNQMLKSTTLYYKDDQVMMKYLKGKVKRERQRQDQDHKCRTEQKELDNYYTRKTQDQNKKHQRSKINVTKRDLYDHPLGGDC